MVLVLTLLLIATSSTNSAPSSLQEEATIRNYATISGRFEIELMGTNDVLPLDNELDVDVLGTVQQTPRYGVSGEAWVDGVWISSLFFDTSLSDRFFIKCTEEKAIDMSSYVWVEWTAPVFEGDQKLPPNDRTQDNFANTIFFESGAESKKLTPPFDIAGGRNGGSTYSYAKVVSSPVRTGAKSIEIYQPPPVKTEGDRRVGVYKDGESSYPREWYLSWWVYFPDESPWNTDDLDGWGTNIGGWKLSFGTSTNNHQWWTGGRFRVDKRTREIIFNYAWHKYPVIGVRKDFLYGSGFYVNKNLNQWVHLQIYVKITTGSDSIIRAWVNDKLIAEKTTWDSTYKCADPKAYSEWKEHNCVWASSSPNGRPRIGIKLYDDYDSKEKRIWVDDIVWATGKVPETYGVVGK